MCTHVVDRGAARVEPHVPVLAGSEVLDLPAERVENSEASPDPLFLRRRTLRQVRSRFKPRSRSTKSMPLRWSVSWQSARASRPVPSISRTAPEASPARTRTRAGRTTFSARSGTERQPSSSFCSPEASRRTGLTRTITAFGSAPTERSMIATLLLTPICGAARPTPGAAWQLSTMSATSPASSSRAGSTSAFSASSRGSPNRTMSRIKTALPGTAGPGRWTAACPRPSKACLHRVTACALRPRGLRP